MRRLPSRLTLLVSVILLPSLLFACGGGGKKAVALDQWVEDLCDAAADFEKASDRAGAEFDDADFEDTKEAKKAFATAIDEQKDAQKDFREAFDKIGKPDIEGGDDVIKAFEEQFDENDELTDDIAKKIEDIDDDEDFLEAFLAIADDFKEPEFRTRLEDVADDNDEVDDLIEAIEDDEDCAATIFNSDEIGQEPDTDPTPSTGRTPAATRTTAAANTTNEKWVAGICSSFGGWVQDIEKANATFQTALERSTGDAPAVKKLLVDFLKIGRTETVELQRQVGALKAPDVTDGAKIQKVFADTSGELVKVFDDLIADAEKISTSSPTQTRADIDRLVDGIDAAFDEASAGFDKLDNFDAPQLEGIFETRPECQGF